MQSPFLVCRTLTKPAYHLLHLEQGQAVVVTGWYIRMAMLVCTIMYVACCWLALAIDLSCQVNPRNGHKHSTTRTLLFANCAKFLYTGIASTLDVCQYASPFVVTLP